MNQAIQIKSRKRLWSHFKID